VAWLLDAKPADCGFAKDIELLHSNRVKKVKKLNEYIAVTADHRSGLKH
jgi:hypothetical protein